MEREPQPERDVEELEERAEELEKDIDKAKDQAAETDGIEVEPEE
jgi:hypothetical protein